ncbi:MAG: M48 family metalloprotease [Gammaproteobacteria bacterium]|nr:M48 family metalloprotease [Gammaproteobacteria bacterium]
MALKVLAVLFLIAITNACTTASHVKPLSDSPQENDPDQEETSKLIQLSDDYHKELKRKGLLYRDEATNQYVNSIGEKLAPNFLQLGEDLNFYIIKDATANAAALPNGNVYINIGLLSVAENEDQLAAILAHELGHVIYRHSLKAMLTRQDTRRAANIADIFLLGTGLSYISAQSSLAHYSREQEREADMTSLAYMHQAGYDVRQIPEIFMIFQTLPESLTVKHSIYSSHPDNKERIDYLQEKIDEEYSGMEIKPVKSEAFNNSRSKIVEENVKIRLNDHQYELALLTLEQVEKYYQKAALIQYYRGEAYRLKAKNPAKAAKEMEWLSSAYDDEDDREDDVSGQESDTERDTKVKQDLDYFNNNKAAHYDKARSFYDEALQLKPDLARAYKGLGLICYSRKDYTKAIHHFNTYLDMATAPSDRLYINRLIRNSKQMDEKHD